MTTIVNWNGTAWAVPNGETIPVDPPDIFGPSAWAYKTVTLLNPGTFGARPSDVPAPITERPSGPGYIRYEDLYQSGDTITQAMERMGASGIITFPEGEFLTYGFPEAQGYASILIPKRCDGIIGSGKGTLGGSTGTVFKLAPNSNPKYTAPPVGSSQASLARVMMRIDSLRGATYANYQVAGSEQINGSVSTVFHGQNEYNPNGKVTFQDLLVTGWYGDMGHPPGEAFGLIIRGKAGGPELHGHRMVRVEADGRRTPGGPIYGCVGLWWANTVGGYSIDCNSHHASSSPWVAYQAFNVDTYDCIFDQSAPGSGALIKNCVNHERTNGFRHFRGQFLRTTLDKGTHVTHSNDGWSANYDGTTRSVSNGTATFIDPTFTNIHQRNKFIIESWTPYSIGGMEVGGDSMVTAPKVVTDDGITTIPYNWVHGQFYNIP